jgi:hypothetical protein
MTSNQVKFDEYLFPFRKQKMVEQYQSDNSTDILFSTPSNVKWIPYNRLHLANYTRVHFDSTSDVMVMLINTETNTYTRVTQTRYLLDKLEWSKVVAEEHQAHFAGVSHRTLKGLSSSIDPDRPPKNYQDALSRADKQEWVEAYDKNIVDSKNEMHSRWFGPRRG